MMRPIVTGIILSLLGSSIAFAQPMPRYKNDGPGKPQQYNQSHRGPGPAGPAYDHRGPRHSNWSKGKRLPPNYRGNVVRDYGRYRLPPPRRGQQWVRVNNEYLLIGITSGIIASMVQGR